MTKRAIESQWKALSRNDWSEILSLSEKKAFQRKFQIVEAYVALAAKRGLGEISHADIAKACKITRQLVDHHFPTNAELVALSYRFIYARFQKEASDAVLARMGFTSRVQAYLNSVSDWMLNRPSDARFLVLFYSLRHSDPALLALHERNTKIGQERIASMCLAAQKEGLLTGLNEVELWIRAASMQKQIIGFLVFATAENPPLVSEEMKKELLRCCMQILA